MEKKYQWLLLDLDNTIFDFNTSSRLALSTLMQEVGIADTDENWKIYVDINKQMWGKLETGEYTADQVKWKRFDKFFERFGISYNAEKANEFYLESLIDHFRLIPGTDEVVRQLSGEYRLMAITNGLQKVQKPRLRKSGLYDFFEGVVVSEEIGSAKPQKAFFDHAFDLMSQPAKENTLVVGDSLSSDIKGAKNYGLHACWVNPHNNENTTELKPEYEIEDLRELFEIL